MENEIITSMSSAQSIFTVVVTALTVFTSTTAWNFWIKRMEIKNANKVKEIESKQKENSEFKDNLKERLSLLELKLDKAERKNEELQEQIIGLVEKIGGLNVEVEILRKENEVLRAASGIPN